MRRLPLLLSALALAGCAHLPPPGAVKMRPLSVPVTSFVAPSGMRVVIEQDPGAKAVGVVAVVGAGAAADPAGKEGLAHLVEHLTFRSRPDGKNQLQDLLEIAGAGDVNAMTGLDTTTYYAFGAPASLQSLLNLVGVQVAAPLSNIDQATFDTERAVIANELRERHDHGDYNELIGWMQHALYPDGGVYARASAGGDALATLTLDDAKAFVAAHYVPANMTLVVAGDVTRDQVAQLMDRVLPAKLHDFAPHSEEAPKLVAQEPPAPPPHAMYRYEGPVDGPTLYLTWSLPPGFGENDGLETMLEHQLDSQLGTAFYKDDDIASVSASVVRGKQASLLFCEVKLLKGEHPDETANYVLDEAFKTWAAANHGFVRQRMRISTTVLAGLENLEARAVSRAETMQLTGDPGTLNRTWVQLVSADPGKLQHFAYKYLSRDRARMLLVTPAKAAPVTAAKAEDATLGSDLPPVKYDPSIIAKIAQSPEVGSFRSFELPNGLKVAIGQRASWPQVTVVLSLEGGEGDGPVPGAGVLAQLAGQDEDSYVHGYPGDYGALMGDGSDGETTTVYAVGGGGNIANLLAMLSDRVGHMTFKGYELDEAGPRYRKLVGHGWEQPRTAARRALDHALYGDSAKGHLLTADELARVDASQVGAWLDRTYDPHHAALAIVGDVDPVATEALVREWMGGWSVDPQTPWSSQVQLATAPKARVLVTEGSTAQTEVTLACATQAATPKDRAGLEILAEILSQTLDRSVRQTLGASYGFHPSVRSFRGGEAELSVNGAVDPTRLQTVLRDLHHQWALLPLALNQTELGRARWALARSFAVGFLTDVSLAGTVADTLRRGEPLDSVDDYAARLNGLTRAELQDLAKRCAQDSAISVVGDPANAHGALKGIWE